MSQPPFRRSSAWSLVLCATTLTCSEPTAPPEPAKLAVVTAPGPVVQNRVAFVVQPGVRLETSDGSPVARAGVEVSVAVTAGGGVLAGTTTAVTNASGSATFTGLSIQGSAGDRTLTFSAPGLASASVNVSTIGGVATAIALHAGDQQTEAEGIPVPVRPSVRLTDADGNGAPAAVVTFSVTGGGGSVTGTTQTTDMDGVAAVGSWTLGAAGPNALAASASGVTGVVTWAATALRLTVASVSVTSPSADALVATTTRQLTAVARDSVGRVLSNRAFTWASLSPGIASVSTDAGVVTGELPGLASIEASSEGKTGAVSLTVVAPTLQIAVATPENDSSLTGHMGAVVNNNDGPPAGFEYGFGYYSSVHVLSPVHARRSQLGWGSWMMPDNRTFNDPLCPVGTVARDFWDERAPSYRDVYQTIEGGMGKWGSTRFPHALSKFRVNGTPDCYNHQISSSAWTFGGDLLPPDKLGLAQLSNRLLVPPDGFTFSTGASLFGNAWIALPLIPAYTAANGLAVGDQSWTLFVKASNFSGPVAFYTPETWTLVHLTDPTGRGRSHDVRPMFGGGVAMEMGTLPFFTGTGPDGTKYRRVPRITFPLSSGGQSVLQQDLVLFSKQAIWDGVAGWMAGGAAVTSFHAAGQFAPAVTQGNIGLTMGGQVVEYPPSFFAGAVSTAGGGQAFGLRWSGSDFEHGVYPEYYRLTGETWTAVPAAEVPRTTWLVDQEFPPLQRGSFPAPSTSASAPFSSAAWAAGPFVTALADGSSVEYVWYRFVEQPAIARLGLSAEVLAQLQAFVESLHATAGTAGPSLPPPSSGTLTTFDAALLVTPPPGLETGYVPVVIRQF